MQLTITGNMLGVIFRPVVYAYDEYDVKIARWRSLQNTADLRPK